MPPQKKLGIFAVILLVLAAISAFLWFNGRPAAKAFNPLQKVPTDDLSRIIFDGKSGEITVEQKNKQWSMLAPMNDALDQRTIDELTNTLKNFSVTSVVSESKSHYKDFQVEGAGAIHLRVFSVKSDKPILDGYIGKPAIGYSDSFFRFEGKTPVYLAKDLPNYVFSRPPEDLLQHRLLPGNIYESMRVAIESEKQHFEMSRSSWTWMNEITKQKVNPGLAKLLTDKLENLNAAQFTKTTEPVSTLGFDHPFLRIIVTDTQGRVTAAMIGKALPQTDKKTLPNRYAQTAGRSTIMIVSGTALNDLFEHLKLMK